MKVLHVIDACLTSPADVLSHSALAPRDEHFLVTFHNGTAPCAPSAFSRSWTVSRGGTAALLRVAHRVRPDLVRLHDDVVGRAGRAILARRVPVVRGAGEPHGACALSGVDVVDLLLGDGLASDGADHGYGWRPVASPVGGGVLCAADRIDELRRRVDAAVALLDARAAVTRADHRHRALAAR